MKKYYEAKLHEDILSGIKKYCDRCNGRGKVEDLQGHYSRYDEMIECSACKGRGYLEKKWC